MWLFVLFLTVPLIEIALFIQIGGWIGLWATLGIVVLTAFLGTILVRSQGASALGELRQSFETLNDPTEPLAHGAMILFSGALLLTPGFFTDAVGFALLIPGVRTAVYKYARSRVRVQTVHYGRAQQTPRRDDVLDGEYEEIEPEVSDRPKPTHPSGWTRH